MARLGRGQPFAPHLARPIVGTAPVPLLLPRAQIHLYANGTATALFARRIKPHVARPITGAVPTPMLFAPRAYIKSSVRQTARTLYSRRIRPHLALPVPALFINSRWANFVNNGMSATSFTNSGMH